MISLGAYTSKEVKNVVLLGHSGCGKSIIAESALFMGGVLTRMGKVEDGNTVSDYNEEEVKRKTSIHSSIIPVEWQGIKINFIDTPGYYDYVGETMQGISVADVALIVVSAKSGVEVGTIRAWEYATKHNIPKMIFINGMDDPNVKLAPLVEELKAKFGKSIAPLQVPIRENGEFKGFVHGIKKSARFFKGDIIEEGQIPDELMDDVLSAHEMIKEAVAETSDELMEKYFEGEDFTISEMVEGLKTGMTTGEVTPVFCGIASMGVGIRILLNSIHEFVPSFYRVSGGTIDAYNLKTEDDVTLRCEKDETTTAFVFKTIADPYVGKLSVFKVYSGKVTKDMLLYNPRTESLEKAGNLYVLRGKEQLEVKELNAGDIGAIAKLSNTQTGDTLCEKGKELKLYKEINYPKSLMVMALKPKQEGKEDKLAAAFSKLTEEDKTLSLEVDKETKQTIIRAIGDTHIDVVLAKLKNNYKIEVDLEEPIVPYRELLKSKVKVQGKYKKQSGGHGQYGDVHIEFEPSYNNDESYIFEEKIFGGSVPKNYFPAVEKGLQESVKSGPLAGYPVVGIKATLVDGSYHAVDSSEMAFKMATILAFKKAFDEGQVAILEPIAKVDIAVPEEYTGDVMGDLSKRKGKVLGMEEKEGKQHIIGEVPLSEMFKYPIELRSMTHGHGTFDLEIDRYDEASYETQQKVIESRK